MEIYIYIKMNKSQLDLTADYLRQLILYIKNMMMGEGERCKEGGG